jgi:hypothetical protein
MVSPPTIIMLALVVKVSVMVVDGKLTPLVELVINKAELAPTIYPPEPPVLAVVIDKKLVLELLTDKLNVSVDSTKAIGVVYVKLGLKLSPT